MKKVFGDAVFNGAAHALNKPATTGPATKKLIVPKEDVKGSGMKVDKEKRKETNKD